ncbi:hypothetical protein J2Z23_003736 [Lederbergia galactosidilyticus]|nr:hypothetical protein [Lederbergia galactosidilytica]
MLVFYCRKIFTKKRMKFSQTNDFELVAKLNKYVHDLYDN